MGNGTRREDTRIHGKGRDKVREIKKYGGKKGMGILREAEGKKRKCASTEMSAGSERERAIGEGGILEWERERRQFFEERCRDTGMGEEMGFSQEN